MSSDDAPQGLPALALNFGPWAESGLATVSGEKGRQIWRARGTEYISSTLGVEALDAVVGSDFSHAVVTVTKWPVFLQQFAKAPSLYNELRKEAAPDVPAAGLSLDRATLRLKLKEATPAQRRDMLTAFVLEQAMKTLGITSPIDTERPLAEFGLDSLMSVTLLNRLEVPLGVKVSAAKLIQGPSVRQLADDLSAEWAQDADEAVQEVKPAPASARELADRCRAEAPSSISPILLSFRRRRFSDLSDLVGSLDKAIEVVAIEPPGRLGRIEEKPISDVDEFVDKLVFEMRGLLDRPFAFFGHCLGGLTMYETARRLIHSTRSSALPPVCFRREAARSDRRLGSVRGTLDTGSYEPGGISDQRAAVRAAGRHIQPNYSPLQYPGHGPDARQSRTAQYHASCDPRRVQDGQQL